MDDKRLQEIKKEHDKRVDDRDAYEWDMFVSDAMPELISAYEQAQAELAVAHETICRRNTAISEGATSSEHVRKIVQELREQLAETQTEVGRRGVLIDELREGLMGECDG